MEDQPEDDPAHQYPERIPPSSQEALEALQPPALDPRSLLPKMTRNPTQIVWESGGGPEYWS
jgi:hypothetical protein